MIYAGDQWIQYPVKDLYDKTIMLMSIAAARDMYEKGQKQLEDFNKTYGDFMSPIAKDMEWYNQNVTGRVRDTINNLYANGIDPLRSAEGRAAISLLIYNMPTGNIAKIRLSAEAAKEYIKNRGILEASGKWDPNFERFANNGMSLEDWDTISGGVWNRTSPAEMKTLKEVTEDWYNQRQAHMLDKAGVESFGMKYDPRYNYQGFTDQDLLDIAAGLTPGWNGSIYADYYRDVARRMASINKLANNDYSPVTDLDVEKQLQRNIATANREYLIAPTKEADQFVLDDYRTKNDIRAHAANRATDHKYWKLEHGGDEDNNKYHRIFREAERNVVSNSSQLIPGNHVQYEIDQQYSQWIDPAVQAEQRDIKLDTGQVIPGWLFLSRRMKNYGLVYVIGENGNMQQTKSPNAQKGEYNFIPGGNMRAIKHGNGYKYYVSGYMYKPDGTPFDVGGNKEIWVEVKERDHNYGQNLRKE